MGIVPKEDFFVNYLRFIMTFTVIVAFDRVAGLAQ